MNEVITTLVSVPFAVALTAILRKHFPSIDGAYVYAIVLVLTVLGAVLGHYQASIPTEVWVAAGPLLAAILAIGGDTWITKKLPEKVEDPFDAIEAPTKKEGR